MASQIGDRVEIALRFCGFRKSEDRYGTVEAKSGRHLTIKLDSGRREVWKSSEVVTIAHA